MQHTLDLYGEKKSVTADSLEQLLAEAKKVFEANLEKAKLSYDKDDFSLEITAEADFKEFLEYISDANLSADDKIIHINLEQDSEEEVKEGEEVKE